MVRTSGGIAIACVALLLELVLLWNGPGYAPGYHADLRYKEPDTELELAGFYIPELNAEFPYRWSQPYAFVQLPNAANLAQGYIASFHMRVPNPEAVRPVTVLVNEHPQMVFSPTAGFRHYSFVLPVSPNSADLRVALSTTELRLPGDVRPLGLVFTDAELRPILRRHPELILIGVLGMFMVAGLMRLRGTGILSGLGAAAILGFGLAAMLLVARPAALSYPILAGFGILAACAAILSTERNITRLALIALLQIPVLSAVLWSNWLTDDAFISFRYAQNLAEGHGLVYNLGERVEGYTNFLWTILAAVVIRLGGDIGWWAYAAGMVLGLAIVLLSFKLAAMLLGDAWGLLAALIVATNQGLLIYTARGAGLETGLFTFLALAGLYVGFRDWGLERGAWESGKVGKWESGKVGEHETEDRRHETRDRRYDIRDRRQETGDRRQETGDRRQETGDRRQEIRDSRTAILDQGAGGFARPPRNSTQFWHGRRGLQPEPAGEFPVTIRTIVAGLLFGLATLTRPEGALMFGIWFVFGIANRIVQPHHLVAGEPQKGVAGEPQDIAALLAYTALVLPYFLWRLSYYGDLLPNTFYAKTGGGLQAIMRGLEYSAGFALAMGGPLLLFAFVPILARTKAALLARMLGWPGMLLAVCLAYTLYIVRVGGDHFPGQRFFVPLVPWLAVLVGAGLARSYSWLNTRRSGFGKRVTASGLAILLICYSMYALWRAPEQNQIVRGSNESLHIWQELGWWLADHAAPDESISVLSAGAIAFYSERTTIDMLGLTDMHIGRLESPDFGSGPAGHEKRDPDYVLYERQPTYIPRWWDGYFGGAQVLSQLYEPISITTRYGRVIELWRRR